MEIYLNASNIKSIIVSDRFEGMYSHSTNSITKYFYKPFKEVVGDTPPFIYRLLGAKRKVTTYPEGFYLNGSRLESYLDVKEVAESSALEIHGGSVWTRPFVIISYSSAMPLITYFDSIEKAEEFVKEKFKGLDLLKFNHLLNQ